MDMNQPLAEQPWWVKTIVWVGLPAAGCAYLLYFVLGTLTARLDTIGSRFEVQSSQLAELVKQLQAQTDQAWSTQNTLARICLNTAKSEPDKLACISVARK